MSCERQIPYAVMNWRILIEEEFFFVDHTRYRDSLPARPGWDHTVETAVVEVYGNIGYKWFPVEI